jgi:hypothetical protein
MGRPTKQGIDFFPMDCDPDGSLEMFIIENGAEGFGLLVMLWQMIYKGDGYFIKYDDDLLLRLKKDSLSAMEKVVSVVQNAIKRGIYSEDLFKKYEILTSHGIQKRYFPIARKKKSINVVQEFLLFDVSGCENLIYSAGNPVFDDGNATKEKEKEKEKEKGEGEGEGQKQVLDNPGFSDEFMKTVWAFFAKNKKGPYKNTATQGVAIRQLFEMAENEDEAKQALRETLTNNYQGFTWFFDRKKEKEAKKDGKEQRINGYTKADHAALAYKLAGGGSMGI